MPKGSSPGTRVHRVGRVFGFGWGEQFVVGYDDGDVAQVVGEFVLVARRGCQGMVLYVQDTGIWGMGKEKWLPLKGFYIALWSSIFRWDGVFNVAPGGCHLGSSSDANICLKLHLSLHTKGNFKSMSLQRHLCRPMAQLLPVWD